MRLPKCKMSIARRLHRLRRLEMLLRPVGDMHHVHILIEELVFPLRALEVVLDRPPSRCDVPILVEQRQLYRGWHAARIVQEEIEEC